MKRFTMCLAVVVAVCWSTILFAADYVAAANAEGNVVVAVKPYTEMKEAKKLEAFRGFKGARIVPVGIFIQNNSNHRIWVFRDIAFKDTDAKLYAYPMIESAERPLGVLGGYNFFEDGQKINNDLHTQYDKKGNIPQLSQNEVFSPDWVEPGKSYYGLVYVALHEPKVPEQYHSIHYLKDTKLPISGVMKVVGDSTILVSYLAPESGNRYVAEFPLAVTSDSHGTIAVAGRMSNGDLESKTGFYHAGHAGNGFSTDTYLDQFKSFHACYLKSIVRSAMGANCKYYGKDESVATLSYNDFGELVTQNLDESTGNKILDKKLLKVIYGMKQCDFPQMKERKNDKFGKSDVAYRYKIKLGRVFAEGK